jgi:hypothetical protein
MDGLDTVTLRPVTRDTVAGMQFDAVLSEEHGQKLAVTENPIEKGVSIADHCYMEQATLTLKASVSDIRLPNAPDIYAQSLGRSNHAYMMLVSLQQRLANKELEPFDIMTSVKTYPDMVLTELSMSRDKTTAFLGRFTMVFKQIITIDTQMVPYQAQAGPVRRSAAPKQQQGEQQAPVATDKQEQAAKPYVSNLAAMFTGQQATHPLPFLKGGLFGAPGGQ